VAESADDLTTLSGTLERVVFQNEHSQWTVARLSPEGGGPEVTAVGALLGVPIGSALLLRGRWVNDPRFGRQFKIESYAQKSPETLVGIERYLGSGLVPGIGPELAKRIVAAFGLDTLEVINHRPEQLTAVEGIGQARANKIAEAWSEQREVQDVMVFLRGHGVSSAYAARIYKRYGKDAVGLIRQNPYRLSLDIWGIGFKSADRIAQSLGLGREAPERLEAGLVHVLGELASDGHMHVPEDELVAAAGRILEVDAGLLGDPLARLVATGALVSEQLGDRGRCLSLRAMWVSETAAAASFAKLVTTPAGALAVSVDAAVHAFETEAGLRLAPQQRRAIEAVALDKCVVVTGGPGVGKTTIVRGILSLLSRAGLSVALAAPTGRAAKRLSETTGAAAVTIHRLLAFQPATGQFERNADAPVEAEAVIIDETSMVDVPLFRALVAALEPTTRLVLVGDVDQLPSVGPGAVLADVIASGTATVVRLTEIFRQAAESQIVVNAHRVNAGELPELGPPANPERADFFFFERDDPVAGRDTLIELVSDRIPRKFGYDAFTEIQVLTPMHRGDLGTATLNAGLQARLNPPRPGQPAIERGERVFRAGDKVMQIRNNYDKAVFNGDVGVIAAMSADAKSLVVELTDGRRAAYERDEIDQLVHAFAVSVHKSQGSEYPCVVIPLVTQHYMMLQRNLLYTAITRGKRLVVLLGSRRAVAMAVRNDATKTRFTWLAHRIRDAADAAGEVL
jgi:exodeoxyribonuclease V alpha subunit